MFNDVEISTESIDQKFKLENIMCPTTLHQELERKYACSGTGRSQEG